MKLRAENASFQRVIVPYYPGLVGTSTVIRSGYLIKMPCDATIAIARAKSEDSDTNLVDISLRLKWLGRRVHPQPYVPSNSMALWKYPRV